MVDNIFTDLYITYDDVESFIDYYDGLARDVEDEDYSESERAEFQALLHEHDPARVAELRAMLDSSRHEDFIREDNWLAYATELFNDVCAPRIPAEYRSYIDYEKWADDLLADYTSVDYDGYTYYHR